MDPQGRIYDMQANFIGTYPNNQEQPAGFEAYEMPVDDQYME